MAKLAYTQQLIILFKNAQQELIKIIQETEARGNVATYQKSLLKQTNSELALLQSRANSVLESLIVESYINGIRYTNRKLNIKEKVLLENLSRVHRKTINVYIRNLQGDLTDVEYFIGRQIKDNIQKASMDAVGLKLSTNETLRECKKNILKNFAENGISAIKTKNGREIRMDAYADMVARSTTREITNTATIKQVEELGYDLVKMSSHPGACPICQEFEGRVYSISGKDKRFPKLDIAFSNGYANIHPRCRHVLEPFIEELNDVDKYIKISNEPFEEPSKNSKQVQEYYKQQREKQILRQDRLQWEKYKTVLKNEAPATLAGFRRMKTANSDNYKEIKRKYKETLAREN
ncbi:MAG: hypothetical protein ACFWUA_05135 [Sporanaerobacter sp.]|uniref:phage minor capsid protein n=1 Tax=Sporanaerobacter sp. TaxID=2010183 RepID=UPI003A0FF217